MVREVRNALLVAALCMVCCPAVAMADEDGGVPASPVVVDNSTRLDTIDQHVRDVSATVDNERVELVTHLNTIETYLAPKVPVEGDENTDEKSPELEQLECIGKGIDGLDKRLESMSKSMENEVEQIEEQKSLSDSKAGGLTVTVYGNVSPTGSYAEYAKGLLPRMEYKDHYVFLQDTSSSYVMAYGDLTLGNGSISGTGKWSRWYYSGNQYGYLYEKGNGSISVTLNNHVVMSDLGDYPMFESNEQIRKEVGFYAVVGVSIFSFCTVLGFVLRLRGAVAV